MAYDPSNSVASILDAFNLRLAALEGSTPTPTPAPVFTTQPSISPTSGTANSTTFTANDGVASNATSYTRRWLLAGTAIGTGTTVSPTSAGSLVLEVTASGAGGNTVANSVAVTVAPTPTPGPTPTPTPGAAVSAPTGFTASSFPYLPTITRTGSGSASTFSTDYNETARKSRINTVTTYYVRTAGNNNNDGLTAGTAFQSLRLALKMGIDTAQPFKVNYEAAAPGDAAIVYRDNLSQARSGQATNNATWGQAIKTTEFTVDCVFEPSVAGGVAYNCANSLATPAFAATSDPNIFVATLANSNATPNAVADFANRDKYGNPRMLARVVNAPADAANPWPEINALFAATQNVVDDPNTPADATPYTLGAMWRDQTNTKLYVRMFDGRNPNGATNLVCSSVISAAVGIATATPNPVRAVIDGLRFVCGNGAPFIIRADGTVRPQFDFIRSSFLGVGGIGSLQLESTATTGGCDVITVNCTAGYGLLDGFNAHQVVSLLEIGNYSPWPGWDTGGLANNGTTLHEECVGISINGLYVHSQDRPVHDINNAKRWMLGCRASSRRGPDGTPQSTAYTAGIAGQTNTQATFMWLDACKVLASKAGPSQYTTWVDGVNSYLRYANLDFVPTVGGGTGKVEAYSA